MYKKKLHGRQMHNIGPSIVAVRMNWFQSHFMESMIIGQIGKIRIALYSPEVVYVKKLFHSVGGFPV